MSAKYFDGDVQPRAMRARSGPTSPSLGVDGRCLPLLLALLLSLLYNIYRTLIVPLETQAMSQNRMTQNIESLTVSRADETAIHCDQTILTQIVNKTTRLRETLQSLKAGLEECAALLAPAENGSTLVLSSLRSESLKGLITRVGTRIVKGVRYPASHPPPSRRTEQNTECQTAYSKPSTSPSRAFSKNECEVDFTGQLAL